MGLDQIKFLLEVFETVFVKRRQDCHSGLFFYAIILFLVNVDSIDAMALNIHLMCHGVTLGLAKTYAAL